MLGVVQPGQQPSLFRDALARLTDRLHYLNLGHNRYWLDTRPNLRREMEERKRRFDLREDVLPTLRERIQRMLGSKGIRCRHTERRRARRSAAAAGRDAAGGRLQPQRPQPSAGACRRACSRNGASSHASGKPTAVPGPGSGQCTVCRTTCAPGWRGAAS